MNDKERARRKRCDLPRARVAGTIHQVERVRLIETNVAWRKRMNIEYENETVCGRLFRHNTLPETYPVTCMECIAMEAIDVLKFELEHAKQDHMKACQLVAQMHAAAVGEVRGPNRGVVEDVADLRRERDELKRENMRLRAALEALGGA